MAKIVSTTWGDSDPRLVAGVPGTRALELVEILSTTECPSLTTRRARRQERTGAPQDPIVWAEAFGSNIRDIDGNIFVDFTAAFGVAAAGHAHPQITSAISAQASKLVHGFGDVHPSDVKVNLLDRLRRLAPFDDARVILGLNGADAVEAAMKTAVLATKRAGILAFEGGYHGLSHGPLSACGYSNAFRAPFSGQINANVAFAPYPDAASTSVEIAMQRVRETWAEATTQFEIGAVLVEPIQGRGGVVIPPDGFLRALGEFAREQHAVFIVDEIFTGLGRTGSRFASVREGVIPDLICIGKALGGGLPTSACLGQGDIMRAWGDPGGEAIHTGTFFGNPIACAASLASLDLLEHEKLAERSEHCGRDFLEALQSRFSNHPKIRAIRGRGLMVGIEFHTDEFALRVVHELLLRGYITLPAGRRANILSLTPPLTISTRLLASFIDTLESCIP